MWVSFRSAATIHRAFEGLWPLQTSLAELLPWPDERVTRAVYFGPIDPRTLGCSVIGWTRYFDEIVVLNPFIHPKRVRPELNPINAPSRYKQQTLRDVSVLFQLMPHIEAGRIHLVPDPGHLDPTLDDLLMKAAERHGDLEYSEEDEAFFDRLSRDDHKMMLARLSDDALKREFLRADAQLSEELLTGMIAQLRSDADAHPFSLRQPMPTSESDAEYTIMRGMNLERALFFSQLMGATLLTDRHVLWRQLQKQVTGDPGSVSRAKVWIDLEDMRATQEAGRYEAFRLPLRRWWETSMAPPSAVDSCGLSRALEGIERVATHDGRTGRSVFLYLLTAWAPPSGLMTRLTQRLLLLFGRTPFQLRLPFALLARPIDE